MLITLELDGIFGSNFVYLYILTLSRISIGSTYTLKDVKNAENEIHNIY